MRMQWGWASVCVGLALLVCPTAIAKDDSGAKTVVVDCKKGDSIREALEDKADELIVEFSGTCSENVVIERDNVTLRGISADPTIIRPVGLDPGYALEVIDASKIHLVDFTVRDSYLGISVDHGSSAVLESIVIRDNDGSGLVVSAGSSVTLSDCSAIRNGSFGFSVWGSSTLELARDTVSVASENRIGLLASGCSDFVSRGGTARFEATDNEYGVALQLEASAQANTVANGNDVGLSMYGGTFAGLAEASDNEIGVFLDFGAQLEGCDSLMGNDIAIWSRSGSVVQLRGSEISGNGLGVWIDGSFAWIRMATISDDVIFEFGSRVDFAGYNSITGTISCDDTVLVRGDAACAEPEVLTAEAARIRSMIPERIKGFGPFELEGAPSK